MASISLPLLLKDVTDGARQVEVDGRTLAEIVTALEGVYPGIEARVHQDGKMSPTLAFVVDGTIAAGGLATPVKPDSRINILPAFGGG